MCAHSPAILRQLARFFAAVLLFLGTVGEAEHARFHAAALRYEAAIAAGETSDRHGLWPGDPPCPLCEIEGTLTQSAHAPTFDLSPVFLSSTEFVAPTTPALLRIGHRDLDRARGPPPSFLG